MPRLTEADIPEQKLQRQFLTPVLREAEQRNGQTLRWLATRTGLTTHYLTQIRQGKRRPAPQDLALIAYALTVQTDDDLHAARQLAAKLARIVAVITEHIDHRGPARSTVGDHTLGAVAGHLERIITTRAHARARRQRALDRQNARTQEAREPADPSQPPRHPMGDPHPLHLRRPASELGHPQHATRRTA